MLLAVKRNVRDERKNGCVGDYLNDITSQGYTLLDDHTTTYDMNSWVQTI
jgi:hypothetical protein